jgi:hypothetical protein
MLRTHRIALISRANGSEIGQVGEAERSTLHDPPSDVAL